MRQPAPDTVANAVSTGATMLAFLEGADAAHSACTAAYSATAEVIRYVNASHGAAGDGERVATKEAAQLCR